MVEVKKGAKARKEVIAEDANLRKVSISHIKTQLHDVFYLSDDLVITSLDAQSNTTSNYPAAIDGFSAVIMMAGEATVSIDMETYNIRPNMLVFFNPDCIIKTVHCSADATAYLLAFSKSFVNDIQIDISTSLPIYMRFGKAPVLEVTPDDVNEIRQLFQLIKTMLQSNKERYRHQIIRTLFTTMFYFITEITLREQHREQRQGRCEILFEEFVQLLQQHNSHARNVGFYAQQLNISPKYLSSVVKEVSGQTAAKWIDESVILEAKTLLKYSGKSIQEIAYQLNFSTQSFFGKYFKQHTGSSPSRYKHNS
ncbi:MAG: helix-turn-helix domain-containing protein [Alistipes sp.]